MLALALSKAFYLAATIGSEEIGGGLSLCDDKSLVHEV